MGADGELVRRTQVESVQLVVTVDAKRVAGALRSQLSRSPPHQEVLVHGESALASSGSICKLVNLLGCRHVAPVLLDTHIDLWPSR